MRTPILSDTTIDTPVEIGYAQTTATFTTSSASYVDVTGLQVTVTVTARPVKVIFDAVCSGNTGGQPIGILIMEGGVQLQSCYASAPGANYLLPIHREVRLTPSPGAHTYKVVLCSGGGATSSIQAGPTFPAFIQVIEL